MKIASPAAAVSIPRHTYLEDPRSRLERLSHASACAFPVPLQSLRAFGAEQRRLASGFDDEDDADPVVRSLQLEAHLAVAPDLSSLTLGGGSVATASQTIDQNLIVLESTFPQSLHRRVLLIYDTLDSHSSSRAAMPTTRRTSPAPWSSRRRKSSPSPTKGSTNGGTFSSCRSRRHPARRGTW